MSVDLSYNEWIFQIMEKMRKLFPTCLVWYSKKFNPFKKKSSGDSIGIVTLPFGCVFWIEIHPKEFKFNNPKQRKTLIKFKFKDLQEDIKNEGENK
jgi:hypothetical protein